MTTKAGCSAKQLQIVHEGQFKPIANFFHPALDKQARIEASTGIKNKLIELFAIYSNIQLKPRGKQSPEEQALTTKLLQQLVKTIRDDYSMLSFEELEQAFQMTYNGTFGDFDLSAYYGTPSVGLLHKILKPYRSWRETALFEIREARRVQDENKAKLERKAVQAREYSLAKRNALKYAFNELEKLKSCLESGRDLPSPDLFASKVTFLARYVRPMMDAEMIHFTKQELWDFYNQAKPLAMQELSVNKGHQKGLQTIAHLATINKIRQDETEGQENERLKAVQLRIAKELAIKSLLPNIASVHTNWMRKKYRVSIGSMGIEYANILELEKEKRIRREFMKNQNQEEREEALRLIKDINRKIAQKKSAIIKSVEQLSIEERMELPFPIEVEQRENGTEIIKIKTA